jgi:hypothetical protein
MTRGVHLRSEIICLHLKSINRSLSVLCYRLGRVHIGHQGQESDNRRDDAGGVLHADLVHTTDFQPRHDITVPLAFARQATLTPQSEMAGHLCTAFEAYARLIQKPHTAGYTVVTVHTATPYQPASSHAAHTHCTQALNRPPTVSTPLVEAAPLVSPPSQTLVPATLPAALGPSRQQTCRHVHLLPLLPETQ